MPNGPCLGSPGALTNARRHRTRRRPKKPLESAVDGVTLGADLFIDAAEVRNKSFAPCREPSQFGDLLLRGRDPCLLCVAGRSQLFVLLVF